MALPLRIRFQADLFNPVYIPTYGERSRELHFYGGAGSGKSVWVAQYWLLRALEEPGHRILVLRKVARTIRRSCFQLLKDIVLAWGIGAVVDATEGEMELRLANGSTFIFAGLDDPEKLKSIAGITGVWLEEATEATEGDFNQVDLRLRGETRYPKTITLAYNPIDANHWIYRRYFEGWELARRFFRRPDRDAAILRTTFLDNRFIDAAYRARLRRLRELDPTLYKVYALGGWASPENLIYPAWSGCDDLPGTGEQIYGLDFGFNVPTALVAIERQESTLFLDEVLYRTKLTQGALLELLPELVPDRLSPIYADNAEPARIQEIYDAGYNVHPAAKDVSAGIDFMKRFHLRITSGSDNLRKEIRAYKFQTDRQGNVLDRPVKFMDHALDAARYGAYSYGRDSWTDRSTLSLPSGRRTKKENLFAGFES